MRDNIQRARQPEEKEERRNAILTAAEGLLDLHSSSLPSVAEIAAAAGLAKGSVYNYFRTKEEVYLGVLAAGLLRWLGALDAQLSRENSTIDEILNVYVDFCEAEPLTMRLACLASTVLEENISEELAYQFKSHLADGVRMISAKLQQKNTHFDTASAQALFLSSYALTLGIWQLSHPAPVIDKVTEAPQTQILKPQFRFTLFNALNQLWMGAFILLEKKL
jgi:AcrR family transcriptional regulator